MSSGIEALVNREYAYGFVTDVETDTVPAGLNEDIIRTISAKKNEPEFMLEWRLKAYRRWLTMKDPPWGHVRGGPKGVPGLAHDKGAALGQRPVSGHRLQLARLLLRAEERQAAPEP